MLLTCIVFDRVATAENKEGRFNSSESLDNAYFQDCMRAAEPTHSHEYGRFAVCCVWYQNILGEEQVDKGKSYENVLNS